MKSSDSAPLPLPGEDPVARSGVTAAGATAASTLGQASQISMPAEPHPRRKYHLISTAVGLILTPIALLLLCNGLDEVLLATVHTAVDTQLRFVPGIVQGLTWLVGSLLVFGVVIGVGSTMSSGGLASGALAIAGIWMFMPGAQDLARDGDISWLISLEYYVMSPLLPALVAILFGTAFGLHVARIRGRRARRREFDMHQAVNRTQASLPGVQAAAPGVLAAPPPAQRRKHVLSVLVATGLMVVIGAMLIPWSARFTVDAYYAQMEGTVSSSWRIIASIVVMVCLVLIMLMGSESSLAPQVAGLLGGTIPGVTGLLWGEMHLEFLSGLPGNEPTNLIVVAGLLLSLGLVMQACGAACHWARQHGEKLEQADIDRGCGV